MEFYNKHKTAINILLIVLLILLIAAFIYTYKKMANKGGKNNPGNIRTSSAKWIGKTTKPGDTFESFDTLANGIKAMRALLMTYRNKYNIYTIRAIINRWAPPSDGNDTEAYIAVVSKLSGIGPDIVLAMGDYPAIISAMSKQEGNLYVSLPETTNILLA